MCINNRTWYIVVEIFCRKEQRELALILQKDLPTGHGKHMARALLPQYHNSLLQHHQDSLFQLPFRQIPSFKHNLWTQSHSVSLHPSHLVAMHLNTIIRWSPPRHHRSLYHVIIHIYDWQLFTTSICVKTHCIIQLGFVDVYWDMTF